MNIQVLGLNKESIELTPNVQFIQRKINKLDFIKFENFFTILTVLSMLSNWNSKLHTVRIYL